MSPNDPLLIEELRRDEGVRYTPYMDTEGIPTVAVGHNLNAKPLPSGLEYPLNDSQVYSILVDDVTHVFSALDRYLGWWRTLTYPRQRVLASMCFNMGINGLLGFHHMLESITSGDYEGAAEAMLASKWAAQVGDRSVRLADMMEAG